MFEGIKAKRFDKWTNSDKNFQKYQEGKKVKDFKMFNAKDLSTYSSDVNKFSQNYIKRWDADGDGAWTKDEFISMATNGAGIPDECKEDYEQLFDDLFDNLNLDDDDSTVSSEEFAAQLIMADINWETYDKTGRDLSQSLDGKLDYGVYSSIGMNSPADNKEIKQALYDHFYAET